MSIIRMSVTLLLAALLAGCYSWVPTEPAGPEVGSEVRLQLAEGAETAGSDGDVRTIEGRIITQSRDSLVVSAARREKRGTARFGSLRDTVSLSRSEIIRIERHDFSIWKSGLVAAGTVAGVFILFEGFFQGEGGPPLPGDGEEPL